MLGEELCKDPALSRGSRGTTTTFANISGGPGPNTDRDPEEALGARVGALGRNRQTSSSTPPRGGPPRSAEVGPGAPRGVAGLGGPWRRPWPRWWSTRGSRPATTAATATPRRARCPAVSVPTDGAGVAAWRPIPAPPAAPRASPRPGSAQARRPNSRVPLPLVSSQTVSLRAPLSSSPSPKMAVQVGEGTEIADGCPRSRWRGRRQRAGFLGNLACGRPSSFARASGTPERRAALWGGGGGAGPSGVALEGPGPWLPGQLFRPASWSISRARTPTAAAIARMSRAVAPMVSGPAGGGGRRGLGFPRPAGRPAASGVGGLGALGPQGRAVAGAPGQILSRGGCCGTLLAGEGRSCHN